MSNSQMIPKKPRLRSFRRWLHKQLDTKIYNLSGVRLITDRLRVPQDVFNGIYTGQYEDTEAAIIKVKIKPGDRILEIGAGVGFVSILCAQRAGPGNVISFEANPTMETLIRENYALNDVEPELQMKAVTRDGAPVTFHVSENILSSSLYDRSLGAKKIEVSSVALPSLIQERRPNVLVIDVEGAEIDLLGHDPLPGVERIILEVHPHIVGSDEIDAMLSRLEALGMKRTFTHRKSVLLERDA